MASLDLSDWLLVIPARLESSRLPRKMIQDLCGKPLIIRVYENLRNFFGKDLRILVATDSEELGSICSRYEVPFNSTSASHKSGTDRCHEVAAFQKKTYILNVQGDEPFLNPEDLIGIFNSSKKLDEGKILTLAYPSKNKEDFHDPSVVKLLAKGKEAFSFKRLHEEGNPLDFYHHLGVYAYHQKTLAHFCSLPEGYLEKKLRLEQMRALENGIKIDFLEARSASFGIDTLEDLLRARELYPLRKKVISL